MTLDAEHDGSLGSPVAGGTGAVFFACEHHQRNIMFDVVAGCFEDRGRLLVKEIVGETARSDLFPHGRKQLVAQSDIAERATYMTS